MPESSRVLQNSLWVGIQPIILNIISIFATAYIVRNLTQEDYGQFILALSLATMFRPLTELGVRAVVVREVAADLQRGPAVLGHAFSLRLVLSVLAFFGVVITVNALGYPQSTKVITYVACSTLVLVTFSNHLIDAFQGYERMKYIAYGNFLSGSALTLASVLFIAWGFGVMGLTWAYVLGPAVLSILMLVYARRHLPHFRIQIDRKVWKEFLKNGMPFFWVGMVWMFISKVGIVMLSKMRGDEEVAVYGAAMQLVERLQIIPDSLGTALFPAIAALFAQRAAAQINASMQKSFDYLLVLGSATAVGMALLSNQVMGLIYGSTYASGGIVLSMVAAHVPLAFSMVLFVYCLGAIGKQGTVLKSVVVATVAGLAANFILIPRYGAPGLAAAYLIFYTIYFFMGVGLVRKYAGFQIKLISLSKIVVANAVMAGVVILLRPYNLALAIFVPAVVYGFALLALRVLTLKDLREARRAIFHNEKVTPPEPEVTADA